VPLWESLAISHSLNQLPTCLYLDFVNTGRDMLKTYFPQPLALAVCVCLALLFLAPGSIRAASPNIVVSQVYGGGGNSGATLKNDFVELFNRGASPVTITGWSLQYSSSAGVGTIGSTNIHVLSGTIQPGQYFLVGEAAGTGGTTDLPAPDASGSLALSATNGKVFLVNNATALVLDAGGCNASGTVVDLVGFGSANCKEGTATPVLSNTTAAIRNDACTDTDNNAADFFVAAPAPRNTVTALHTCAVSTPPSGTGAASPASVDPGSTTLLTVTVTPGGNPTSAGLTVTGNLQAIGGAASQPFYDDGTHGDVTAGDNVFSYMVTVDAATAPGAKQISISIADTVPRTGTATINVTVNQPAVVATPIHTIQGSGDTSPMVGQIATMTGIVTAIRTSGFYLEAPQAEWDSDPATSEAIYVYGGTTGLVAGDAVQVTGTISEYGSGILATTEVNSPSVTVLSHSNPLPPAVDIVPAAGGAVDQLERYESMLVHIASPQVVAPTGGSSTSDGIFYVTAVGVPRPMREAGLMPGAATITGMPAGVPLFDGNSEKVKVDTSACTVPATVAVGDTVPDVTGPLGISSGDFTAYPACPFTVTNTAHAVALPDPGANEFTVASFNLLNFTNDANRLAKASLAIRSILKSPDMIGVEEMKDLATLQALADKIQTDGGPAYTAALLGTDGSQNVGVLYRTDRVSVSSTVEVGTELTMDNTSHTGQTAVFDRPPLVVTAKIAPGTPSELPVTLFVNHLRSLINVDTNDATGDFVRRKRQAGAEALATFISQHQTAGDNVISVGDYNAFEVNDGYVDVLGTIKGTPTPSDKVLMASADLIDPDLIDLATTKPGSYSYVESGNAQTLDHIVVTSSLTARSYHLEPAHINADFPTTYASDVARPERVSDHDPIVGYFTLPSLAPAPAVTLSASNLAFGGQVISTTSDPKSVTLTNSGTVALAITSIVPSGEFSATNDCPASLDSDTSCTITVKFEPVSTGAKTGAITITDDASGSPHSVALTGNGTPVPVPGITLVPASWDFGDLVINTTAPKTITLTNSGTATLHLASIGGSVGFTPTHTCLASLPAGQSCTITVTFAPTTTGAKTGAITIDDDAAGNPHSVALTGNGVPVPAPVVSLSATSLDFGAQTMSTTSSNKTVTLTNTGTADLAISGIVKTDANSDFTSTHNCPASLSKGLTCTITVTFAPKAAGAKTATVTITHNAAGTPHTVTLTGKGTDFAVAPPTGGSSTATVSAGQTATFNLQIAGSDSFSGSAALSCSGAPDKTTCTASPATATLSGTTPVNFTVTVTTTAATTGAAGFQSVSGPGSGFPFVLAFALFGLGAIVIFAGTGKRQFRFAGACAALLMVVALSSCGSSKATQTVPGTQSGTYTLTVLATANGVSRTLPLTLKVN
jgi:uncharacterized protein